MTAFYLTIRCFIQNQWKCFLAQNPYCLTIFIDKFRKLNTKKDLWVVCPYFKRWQLSLPSTGIRFDEGVIIAPAFLFSQSKPLLHILNFLTQRSHDIIFFSHFCNHFIMKVSVSSACIIFHIPFRMSWHLQFQSFGWKRVISAPSGMESLYSVYSTISDICSNSQVPFFTFNLFSGINCIKMLRILVRLHT